MSKIAEQKAFDAYPPHWQKLAGNGYYDMSLERREGYAKGYDQAMQEIESLPKIKGTITGKYIWLDDEEVTEVITKAFGEVHQPIEVELMIKVNQ